MGPAAIWGGAIAYTCMTCLMPHHCNSFEYVYMFKTHSHYGLLLSVVKA